jgi:hypothetical protein
MCPVPRAIPSLLTLLAAGVLLAAPSHVDSAGLPAAHPSLSGTITLPSGSFAAGARIVVTPLRRVESTVATPDVILARAMARPDGSFSLMIDPGPAIALTAANGGHLNVMVTAIAPDDRAHSWLALAAVPLRPAPGIRAPAALHLVMQRVDSTPPRPGATPEYQCGTTTYRRGDFQYAYTTVAELHSWDDMAAKFKYIYTASSTLDVGTSQDGHSWRVSGTATIADDKGATNGQDAGGRYGYQMRPQFEYEELATQTAPCGGNSILYYTASSTRALAGIVAGANVSDGDGLRPFLANNRPGHMANFDPGGFHAKTTGTTQRYEVAASFFGFNFGCVSQYSSQLDYEWQMGHAFAPGQYHLWGEGPDVDQSHNVHAFSGPVPVP